VVRRARRAVLPPLGAHFHAGIAPHHLQQAIACVQSLVLGLQVFEDGLAFDGSSIRGFQKIHESDMALLPDPTTAYLDPFRVAKTLCLNFFVHDPLTKEPYSRDPRNIARKAETYLASTGIGDTVRTTSVSPIFITKSPDRASPKLTSYAVEGMPLGRIEITFTDDNTQAVTSRWILDGAEVRSINISPDPMNGNKPVEMVEIGYATMTYQYFDPANKTGRPAEEVKFAVPEEQLFPYDAGCH
jgi:type VI protein secretion system component Hcp